MNQSTVSHMLLVCTHVFGVRVGCRRWAGVFLHLSVGGVASVFVVSHHSMDTDRLGTHWVAQAGVM